MVKAYLFSIQIQQLSLLSIPPSLITFLVNINSVVEVIFNE
ncbi:hypothetical protein P20652_2253 [Pseudoalteromonas sp. BSi20652]|nr:hypothetical protein P20652_2253 [Pseudoalteromonas sp. BSi20652]